MECFEGLSALILKALTNKQEKVAYLKKKKGKKSLNLNCLKFC